MVFSSPEYPAFLLAVFFMYLLMRQQGLTNLVARLALLLLLGDLVYLLVVKDVRQLWDPLGYAVYSAYAGALGQVATPPRPWLHLTAGGLVFALTVAVGLRGGAWLDRARVQRATALLFAVVVSGLGVVVVLATWRGRLDRLTHGLGHAGHLLFLAAFGLAVGAALRPGGRRFGRLLMLLLVSALFYHAWAVGMPGAYKYLLLLIVCTIALDYYLALWIDRATSPWARRALLVLSLVSNLGVLCVFKYLGFFLETVRSLAGWVGLPLSGAMAAEATGPVLTLILPAGISFHTFQSLSYTIDVYQRRLRPTTSMLDFATFVLFFPQLVAGPIVRAHEFLPQISRLDGDQADDEAGRPPYLVDAQAAEGLFRILIGLLKKVALADLLATQLVDRVFADPRLFSGVEVLAAVYGYAFQIYLDFSGYSDIAIGSALLLGFTFPENFRTPYRSADLQEFWRRWHITLSTWLRDYLYIPLGGSRGTGWLTYRNLIITMLLGGLWHGASWTFIVWPAGAGGGRR
jgi:D-alanyl-lipoteichoic acid acyltransferase DltB (MBOAT superfamily)